MYFERLEHELYNGKKIIQIRIILKEYNSFKKHVTSAVLIKWLECHGYNDKFLNGC